MARIDVLLKNGKRLYADGGVAQVIQWRSRLVQGETIQLPTWNGTMRVDGRTVRGVSCEIGSLTEGEASAAMMAEPYTHYRTGEQVYQYSEMSKRFEKASRHGGVIIWEETPLAEGVYDRIGRDSVL